MKVYFTAAIYQREELFKEYKAILHVIKELGHEVLTSFDILNKKLDQVLHERSEDTERHFLLWCKTIAKADAAVVEASFPSSVNIGMEVGALLERGKPTICLYLSGRDPVFTSEMHSSRLLKTEYTLDSVKDTLQWGFEEVEQMINRRFTFFISPELDAYLSQVMKKKGISRSDFIRTLIVREMRRNK